MGNRLTVANATDGDIYVSVDTDGMSVKDIKADIGMHGLQPTAGLSYDLQHVDAQLGSVAIGSHRSLRFPKIVWSRYFVTIQKKDWTDLICHGLEIPWHSNVIVTPDVKLAFARSGSIWIDQEDGTDYTPAARIDKTKPEVAVHDVDRPDGESGSVADKSANAKSEVDSRHEIAANLTKSANIPKFVALQFLHGHHDKDMSPDDLSCLARHIEETKQLLAEKIQSDGGAELFNVIDADNVDVDEKLLKETLQRKPFSMHRDDVDRVVAELMANERRRRKMAQLLHQLSSNTDKSTRDVTGAADSSQRQPPTSEASSSPEAAAAAASASATSSSVVEMAATSSAEKVDDDSDNRTLPDHQTADAAANAANSIEPTRRKGMCDVL